MRLSLVRWIGIEPLEWAVKMLFLELGMVIILAFNQFDNPVTLTTIGMIASFLFVAVRLRDWRDEEDEPGENDHFIRDLWCIELSNGCLDVWD